MIVATLTWAVMIAQASELETSEVRRHAMVSINNQHRCTSCFTCACVEVLKQRGKIAKELGISIEQYEVKP